MANDGSGNYNRLFLRTVTGVFDFTGRSSRAEAVVYFILGPMAFGLLLLPLLLILTIGDYHSDLSRSVGTSIQWLYCVPLIALMVRRIHDLGRTGWWAIAALLHFAALLWIDLFSDETVRESVWRSVVKFIAVAIAIMVVCLPGERETNRYGPDPRTV